MNKLEDLIWCLRHRASCLRAPSDCNFCVNDDLLVEAAEALESWNVTAMTNAAIGAPVPKGFGEQIDGKDGERIGTNIATFQQWKDFFNGFWGRLEPEHQSCEHSRDCIKCGKRIEPANGLCFGCATS